ncbi:uncharacterized protein LOC125233612 [Leguminivora glycinivorella]|uniref:uncharacterized protein LOC125233612 n=1 Tax=Leguminivora glycinivorella TaxID=1035111 RepID=UPI00200BD945|nr:uncharacterized protein LOC125233612 [Leguminivora glycinivorella]
MTFGKISSFNWNTCAGPNNGNYIFRNMTENRKRAREDDTCEFMPLSKRINNLHINNNLASTSTSQAQESNMANNINLENGISSPSSSSDSERRPSYDPGISAAQSSYYYENKLLFELHLERTQRSGQQYPF